MLRKRLTMVAKAIAIFSQYHHIFPVRLCLSPLFLLVSLAIAIGVWISGDPSKWFIAGVVVILAAPLTQVVRDAVKEELPHLRWWLALVKNSLHALSPVRTPTATQLQFGSTVVTAEAMSATLHMVRRDEAQKRAAEFRHSPAVAATLQIWASSGGFNNGCVPYHLRPRVCDYEQLEEELSQSHGLCDNYEKNAKETQASFERFWMAWNFLAALGALPRNIATGQPWSNPEAFRKSLIVST